VLQRNTSGIAIILPTLDPPVTVLPGDEIEHDDPLAGFTPVDEDKDNGPDTAPETGDGDKKPASKAARSTGGDQE
jgi:hypothetical protein